MCALLLALAPAVPRASRQQSAAPPAPHLYRFQVLQAAPGRLLELIEAAKKSAALAVKAGDEAPVIVRHSQGDHWDLVVVWPMGEWTVYHDPRARRAAGGGAKRRLSTGGGVRQICTLVAWHEDLYVRGPAVDALRAHVKDASLLHLEMMQALPGKRDALVEERRMENAFNRNRGRGETLIFVRDAGAAWDVVTLGAYRNWRHYAESEMIPPERTTRRRRRRASRTPTASGPYMRTLISTHRDTLGPQIRIER